MSSSASPTVLEWSPGCKHQASEESALSSPGQVHTSVTFELWSKETGAYPRRTKLQSPCPSWHHTACAHTGTRKPLRTQQSGLGLRHLLTLPLFHCEIWESLLDLLFPYSKVGRLHLLQRVDTSFRGTIITKGQSWRCQASSCFSVLCSTCLWTLPHWSPVRKLRP